MIVTTYRHDYIPPTTDKYDLVKRREQNYKTAQCQHKEDNKIEDPKKTQKQNNVEWTGIAPMGRLIHPRIIPTKLSNKQVDLLSENQNHCHKEQQTQFLKILPAAYPDLYGRLKEISTDELNRRLDNNRMRTTYQIDFCDITEYPEDIYKCPKIENATGKVNLVNAMDESCEKSYKPFEISFVDSSRFINSGNSSHWRSNVFIKKAKFSEYMDTISKIGCVITKNNIHDHHKCNKTNCRHKLIHACTNLK